MATREEFISALNELASKGDITALAGAYSNAAMPQDKQDIEISLIAGIEVCERKGWVDVVARLLERTNLSDTVKQQIETSLIVGIEVCGRNGRVDTVADLLGRAGLSNRVMITGIGVCERNRWVNAIAGLLERADLSDRVKQAAEKVVLQSRPVAPTDVVRGYLQGRNPLAGDGVISKGTIRPPGGIAPAGSKPPGRVRV